MIAGPRHSTGSSRAKRGNPLGLHQEGWEGARHRNLGHGPGPHAAQGGPIPVLCPGQEQEGREALRIRRSAGAGRANPALAGAGDYFWKLSRLPGRETPFSFPSFTDRVSLICYVGGFIIIIYLSSLLLTQDSGLFVPCPLVSQPSPFLAAPLLGAASSPAQV